MEIMKIIEELEDKLEEIKSVAVDAYYHGYKDCIQKLKLLTEVK